MTQKEQLPQRHVAATGEAAFKRLLNLRLFLFFTQGLAREHHETAATAIGEDASDETIADFRDPIIGFHLRTIENGQGLS